MQIIYDFLTHSHLLTDEDNHITELLTLHKRSPRVQAAICHQASGRWLLKIPKISLGLGTWGSNHITCIQHKRIFFYFSLSPYHPQVSSASLQSLTILVFFFLFFFWASIRRIHKKAKGPLCTLTHSVFDRKHWRAFKWHAFLKDASSKRSKCCDYVRITPLFIRPCLFWPVINGNNVGGSCWQTGTLLGRIKERFYHLTWRISYLQCQASGSGEPKNCTHTNW